MVMSVYWLLLAFAVSTSRVYCETGPAGQDGKTDGEVPDLTSFVGFKPCIDETCEDYPTYGPSDLEPKDHASQLGKVELPRAHCMLLKPSAVDLFGKIETMHPGISDIKYHILEELIEYMHLFSSFNIQNCKPNMKLLELVILAANSLKAQYLLQEESECIYLNETSEPVPNDNVTQVPCNPQSSGYVTGIPVCPGSTIKPVLESTSPVVPKSTDKPYEPSSTQRIVQEPHVPSSTTLPIVEVTKPCPDGITATTEKPCQSSNTVTEEYSSTEEIEIIAEDEDSETIIPQVGSLRGIPGVHYPNYTDIPITSFTCADKKCIPGFFADLDTGCQVFHVCYEHRRESFLCPVGTIFNQPILACDYWYSSNCSLAPLYYDVNEKAVFEEEKIDAAVEELLTLIEEPVKPQDELSIERDLDKISKFFPVKAIVTDVKPEVAPIESTTSYTEVASEIVDKIAMTATKVTSNARHVIKSIPEPAIPKPVELDFVPAFKKPVKMTDLLKDAVVPLVKAKLAAIPVLKATALKTAAPVIAKSKVVAVKAAVAAPFVKAKVAAIPAVKAAVVAPVIAKSKIAVAAPLLAKAKVAAIPAVKAAVAAPVIAKSKVAVAKGKIAVPAFKVAAAKVAKSSLPALKAKMVASAVPLAKTKVVPLMKAKVAKSAGTPLLKAKLLALPLAKSKLAGPLPLAKVKLAKAAAISPLTKKALALGYMKLLKAKKVALMG